MWLSGESPLGSIPCTEEEKEEEEEEEEGGPWHTMYQGIGAGAPERTFIREAEQGKGKGLCPCGAPQRGR